jgi:hypothetical protein
LGSRHQYEAEKIKEEAGKIKENNQSSVTAGTGPGPTDNAEVAFGCLTGPSLSDCLL